jgi:hypothetical protein
MATDGDSRNGSILVASENLSLTHGTRLGASA